MSSYNYVFVYTKVVNEFYFIMFYSIDEYAYFMYENILMM